MPRSTRATPPPGSLRFEKQVLDLALEMRDVLGLRLVIVYAWTAECVLRTLMAHMKR